MIKLLTSIVFFVPLMVFCQEEPDSTKGPSIHFSGYAEVYYAYDFSKPPNHERADFLYNHKRHNEFNINLGFLNGSYTTERVRANIAIMVGTYAQYNLASEPDLLKNIWEANVGIKLSKSKNLWLDAGIFASHLGFESAVSKDCRTLTRSLAAENSPYYESGVKVTYGSDNGQWTLSGLLLNGWQRIKRVDANNTPALGTQVVFKPTNSLTLNYSTFIGNDQPDSTRKMRYFNNFYGIFQVSENFGITAGFDIGLEQQAKNSNAYYYWYSPVVIARLSLADKLALAGRFEYYQDRDGVIITIANGTANGFQTTSFSLNVDYKITDNALIRVEERSFLSKEDIFPQETGFTNHNFALATSLAVGF